MTSPSSSSALSTLSQPPTPIVTVSQAISQNNAQFSGLRRFLYGSAPYFEYQGYQPPSPYSQHPGAYPSTPPMPGAMPPLPFTLCKIIGNISICDGCRNRYSKHPNPPDDLCIRHQEWREFTPPGSQVPQSRFGNTYYHFSVTCPLSTICSYALGDSSRNFRTARKFS